MSKPKSNLLKWWGDQFVFIVVRGKAPNQRSTKSRCERIQTGVLTPGTGTSTKRKPQRGDRTSNCFVNSILKLCRPVGASFVVALLSGVSTPVCVLSSLRDFGQAPLNCLSSGKPNNRRISRGALDFPPDTKSLFCGFMLVETVGAGEQGQPYDSTTYGV